MLLSLVEPSKQPSEDLPNVMFREAIELLRGVVSLKGFRPGQSCNGFPGSKASVGHAYRLIQRN